MLAQKVFTFILISMCVSTVSLTITKTRIFLPVRHWARTRSWWLGTLLSCPYCLSHWVSGFFVTLLSVKSPLIPFLGIRWLDTIITVFAVVSLVSIITWMMCSSLSKCEGK